MNEKRFQWNERIEGRIVEEFVVDNLTKKELDEEDMYELLNDLSDENKQLKQFKEDVFNKIDMHLRMLPTARDNEFNEENGDPSLYTGAIYMLETLKKELENE